LLIIPVRSGYGPAVSSGDTAQLDDVVVPPVDELLVVDVGVVGEEPQAAAKAALAAPRMSSASRLVNVRVMTSFDREHVAEVLQPVEKSATGTFRALNTR